MQEEKQGLQPLSTYTMPTGEGGNPLPPLEEVKEREETATIIDMFFYFSVAVAVILALSNRVELTETHLIAEAMWLSFLYTFSGSHRVRIAEVYKQLFAQFQEKNTRENLPLEHESG